MNKKLRVIIADDNEHLCYILKKILSQDESIEVIGIVNTEEEEITMINNLKPEVVITDIMRNGQNTGVEIIKSYAHKEDSPQFLILSADTPNCVIFKYPNVITYMQKVGLNYERLLMELKRSKYKGEKTW